MNYEIDCNFKYILLAVTGSSYTFTEYKNDNSNKLCDEFDDCYPAQNTTDQNGCSS